MTQIVEKEIHSLVAAMTTAQKVDLVGGRGLWRTAAMGADAAFGLRYSMTRSMQATSRRTALPHIQCRQPAGRRPRGMFGTTRPTRL